jgi:hypothetical protein
MPQYDLEVLVGRLQEATSHHIPDLARAQVSVFFPMDLLQKGIGEEIIIFVDGLLKKPERTLLLQ